MFYYFWKFFSIINNILIIVIGLPLALLIPFQFWLKKKMDPNYDPVAEWMKLAFPNESNQAFNSFFNHRENGQELFGPNNPDSQGNMAELLGSMITQKMKDEHPELVKDTRKMVGDKLREHNVKS